MKLKTNTSLLVLYVCYWPGLEDYSSGPGIVSRSLSRGESASLSSKHGFFLARELCVFFSKQQHPFFFGREERLYRRNISRCVSLYISKLFAALLFVGPLPRRIKREREREKKTRLLAHPRTLSLSEEEEEEEKAALLCLRVLKAYSF